LLAPIASHAFLSKAIAKLYYASTSDETLFTRKRGIKADMKRKRIKGVAKNGSKNDQDRFNNFK
jgi:hypothetical protein